LARAPNLEAMCSKYLNSGGGWLNSGLRGRLCPLAERFCAGWAAAPGCGGKYAPGEKWLPRRERRLASSCGEILYRTANRKAFGIGAPEMMKRRIGRASADGVQISAKRLDELSFRELLDALPAAIYITDAAGRLAYYNVAAVELAGRKPKIGSDQWCVTWRLYRPDGTPLPLSECPLAVALKSGQPVTGAEVVAERPDGTLVRIMPYPTPLHDVSGNLVGAVNMLVDVTERSQSEQVRQLLASIVESSDDAIVSKDISGQITSWNPGAERLFGYRAQEIVGGPVRKLIPPNLHKEEDEILRRLKRGESIKHYETIRRCKDGSLIDVSLTESPLRNAEGKVTGASSIARDISARKRAESERLIALQDEERRRIANELHDSTAQHLAAIGLFLAALRKRGALESESLKLLREIDGSLEDATKELRAFTYLLHPPQLQRDGLSATLERYVEGFSRRTQLKIAMTLCPTVDQLSLPLQEALLRIVQEALTNVYRHASATRVSIDLTRGGKQLQLVISDDGQGRGEHSGSHNGKAHRLGSIQGMAVRVQRLGGKVSIQSGPKGTAVHTTVPIK